MKKNLFITLVCLMTMVACEYPRPKGKIVPYTKSPDTIMPIRFIIKDGFLFTILKGDPDFYKPRDSIFSVSDCNSSSIYKYGVISPRPRLRLH